MACSSTLTGIALDCANVGGITEVYICKTTDIQTITVTSNVITAITLASMGEDFKTYRFRKGTSNYSAEASKDEAAGTSFVTANVNMKFSKMDVAKRNEMQALLTDNLYVIVKDNNGIYWFIGYNSYVSASSAAGNTGVNRGDANEYSITLTSELNEFPLTVDPTIIASLVA